MKFFTITLLMVLVCRFAIAATYLYCPKTRGYVKLGNTVWQVEKICGKPDTIKVVKNNSKPLPKSNIVRWRYTKLKDINNSHILSNGQLPLVIDFAREYINAIMVFGKAVSTTTYCHINQTVSIGDSKQRVLALCGKPDDIEKVTISHPQKDRQEVLIYGYRQSSGLKLLIFHKFSLVSITP